MIKATDEGLEIDKRLIVSASVIFVLAILLVVFSSIFGFFAFIGVVGYPTTIIGGVLLLFFYLRRCEKGMVSVGESADQISARLRRERRDEDKLYLQVWTDAFNYLTAMDEYNRAEEMLDEGEEYLLNDMDYLWVRGMYKRRSIERKYGYKDVGFDSLLMRKDKAYAIAERFV